MGRNCAFGPNSYLVKREEYCVKEDKSLLGKELKMVKIFLFFSDFGQGYLRVWPKDSEQRVAYSVQDGKTVER